MKQKLAIDLGTTGCGVAITDASNSYAVSLCRLKFQKYRFDQVLKKISEILQEKSVDLIVLGFPVFHYNSPYSNKRWVKTILKFKNLLEKTFNLKVVLQDESYSSQEAQNNMLEFKASKTIRRNSKDTAAAINILERFLKTIR